MIYLDGKMLLLIISKPNLIEFSCNLPHIYKRILLSCNITYFKYSRVIKTHYITFNNIV